jgi:hypothetical protein
MSLEGVPAPSNSFPAGFDLRFQGVTGILGRRWQMQKIR